MTYVFDTSAFSQLFRSYYRARFPTLWGQFDQLLADGKVTSTREALREIGDRNIPGLADWCVANKRIFPAPTADEGAFVARIFAVSHFQQVVEQKKLLRGGKNADPFLVARAGVIGATVVSMEEEKPNSAKIPNICKHFDIACLTVEHFMEAEDWTF